MNKNIRFLSPLLLLAVAGVSAPAFAQNGDGWDAKFGGIGGTRFQGELGWSQLPKLSFLTAAGSKFEIGGAFAFDLGYYSTVVVPQIHFTAPMRISLLHKEKLTIGMKLEPGVGLAFAGGGVGFQILLNSALNIGAIVSKEFIVGGGIDFPLAFVIASGGFGMNFPLLFGPVLEVHPSPEFGILFDAKFGPHIGYASTDRGSGAGVAFGFKIGLGFAYRF